MKIAILGTGSVGSALGKRWAAAGHEIIYGSRQPDSDKVQALLAAEGDIAAIDNATAVSQAEVVVLAVPWSAAEAVVTAVADWHNKILIDATNPIAPGLTLDVGHTTSGGEMVAQWAAGARVVKAFNTTGYNNMRNPDYGGRAAAMFIAGDDADAKTVVLNLTGQLGFDAIDAGNLAIARYLEPLAMLWINLAMRQGLGREIAFTLARR